ncbi:MAG: alpha/beta fold hydrolase [Proteobacteria bacterium]|jgi:triacylglycerol lipase|nr:alpha/beta fold hydrolase [Pseudomonadota bacterium]
MHRSNVMRPDLVVTFCRELVATVRTGMWPFAKLIPLPSPSTVGGRPPVVLLHGFMGHRESFRPLARRMLKSGWTRVERVGYPSTTCHFDEIIERLDRTVKACAKEEKVDLIGHSLGAVACRAYTKLYGGDELVRRFISLGGPHAGTSLYRVTPPNVRHILDPNGEWVKRMSEGPEKVPTIVIRARYDHQVFPPQRASLPGVDEVVLSGYGHNGLLWATESHDAILAALQGDIS